jgi:hypothetical protein
MQSDGYVSDKQMFAAHQNRHLKSFECVSDGGCGGGGF